MIVLLKTGWGDRRGLTKEFLTEWPYLTGVGAEYLLSLGIHGVGIEGLSIGGYDDPEKETAAHKVLLGAKKLIIEDLRIPTEMLDGKPRHFAAFPVLIEKAGGAWTRAVAWDEGEMA
jgi:kynurenine formamidase